MNNRLSTALSAERLGPWVCGVLLAAPVLLVAYPPMSDLPLHEASIGLLRHWGDDRFAPKGLYFLNLGQANQLFSLAVLALSYVVSLTWACKIIVGGLIASLPLAAAHLADHVRAPRWAALLVAPLGLGWLFFWGLVQNLLGLIVLLALLPAIDRFVSKPTGRGSVGMCAAMVLLHFAHQAMLLVACLVIVIFALGSRASARSTALRGAPVVFGALIVVAGNRYARSVAGPQHVLADLFVWYPLWHKVSTIPGVLFGGFEAYVRNTMMALACAAAALLAIGRRTEEPAEAGAGPLKARIHEWRFEILAACLMLLYLAAPANIKSTTLVYHRFLAPAWSVGVIAMAARRSGPFRRVAPLLCGALPVASLLIAWPTFADANEVYDNFSRIIEHVEPGSAVATLELGPQPPVRLWNPVVAAGRLVSERGGRALFDYTTSPTSPVAQRPPKQWNDIYGRVGGQPYNLCPDWDLTRFRYLLVDTPRPTLAEAVAYALRTQASLIAHEGTWYLFESRLPLVPVDSDDEETAYPSPPTLRRKLKDAAKELEAEPDVVVSDINAIAALKPR